jgi:glycosyltransferase involved in cell wall biosynthesis
VVAFPEGAASEIVAHGENGFLVEDEAEMADVIAKLAELDPSRRGVGSTWVDSLWSFASFSMPRW